jgi:hypothetical protein
MPHIDNAMEGDDDGSEDEDPAASECTGLG